MSNNAESQKAAVRVEKFDQLNFVPRFEYGHMATVAEVSGGKDGTELGTGIVRLQNAEIPWTIQYDEVLFVLDGSVTVTTGQQKHQLEAKDSLWLPAGTELVYQAEDALVAYAIHPANWAETQND